VTDTTSAEAYDAAMGVVRTAWEEVGAPTENLELRYWNTGSEVKTAPAPLTSSGTPAAYGQVAITPIGALSDVLGGRSQRWTETETITLGIFTPIGDGGVLERSIRDHVVKRIREHVGSVSGISFVDIVPVRVGQDGSHQHLNVNARFTYQTRVTA
jgi:hypothetical protein